MGDNRLKLVSEIGSRGICTDAEYQILVPSNKFTGSEWLFTVTLKQIMTQDKSFEYLENFIKGYHLIERKYSDAVGNGEFGFGSPSRTHQILLDMQKNGMGSKLQNLVEELEIWISKNGGNYYIKPIRICAPFIDPSEDDN